ncbi:MAG: amino acid permease [Planctomycetota bacterium]|jgi:amino acid transporter/mannitol/fructose-specific phosphotransferase system IIA component (Ntr-type)
MSLQRRLGFWDVFCIASGAMISSGLFVLPAIAFSRAGPAMVAAYALAGVMAIPAAMSKAELATAMPRSGGSYFFIERSLGALPGTLAGLATWLSISLKSAFALIGIGAFARLIWPGMGTTEMKAIAVGFCIVFALLNVISVKHTGRTQIVMVVILLAVLGLFIVRGTPKVSPESFTGFTEAGFLGVFATAGLVFVSFGGLTKVAAIAEEVHHPGRNIPRGMFAALLLVSLLYVGAVFVTQGVLGDRLSEKDLTPLSTAAGEFFGTPGAILLAGAAILAFVTTANGGILTASRSPLAMSRDGLLPEVFAKTSRRFGTPVVSVMMTAGLMIAVIVVLDLKNLVKFASTMMLLLFVLVNLAVIIMRGSRIQNYRPLYRSPGYPWVQIIGIALYAFLIVDMSLTMHWVPLAVTAGFLLAGALWYVVYIRPKTSRESAFVYMVRSAVTKEMYRSTLEDELREIALERDLVVHDRFDRLIKDGIILDLPGPMTSHQMFREASAALAPRLGMAEEELIELFEAREAESSTVVQPGLAIPHIVVEGEKQFQVLLVRCRDGLLFPGHAEPVRAGFVLIGSRDERNFHLRALMAIAHVVEEKRFEERWLAAPEAEHLRDLVLLSTRQRDV